MDNEGKANVRQEYRQEVWDDLREVARPDSRFAWDFNEFIADYEGSKRGAEHIRNLGDEIGVESWFVTPDNNLDSLRESLIKDDIPFVMPSYGIRRGLLRLDSEGIPDGEETFASVLDGVNRFGEELSLTQLSEKYDQFDILVTGASFVTTDGLRMGKGHGYFDLEWGMLRELDLVDETTPVVAVAHDVQILGENLVKRDELMAEHDTIVDHIVTPSGIQHVEDTPAKPQGIYWELLDEEDIAAVPPLVELDERRQS
jgi:5-formyltetrahydrofolate cyclo-ligase